MVKPLQAYRVTSIIAFSLLLASCILLILVGLYPHHQIHIYHQSSCYDLEPCTRESKIYSNQVETRDDCLLYHVRNVRLWLVFFFWIQHFYSVTSKLVLRRKGLQRTQCLGHIYGRKGYGCGLYVSNIVYCGWITYQRSIVTAIWSLGSLCL